MTTTNTAIETTLMNEIRILVTNYKRDRTELASELYDLHAELAKPGREGKWAAFLREVDIAKETARRWMLLEQNRRQGLSVVDPLGSIDEHLVPLDEDEPDTSSPTPTRTALPRPVDSGMRQLKVLYDAATKKQLDSRLAFLCERQQLERDVVVFNLIEAAFN